MKRILTAVLLIPLVLLLIFRGPYWLIVLATAVAAVLAMWEYLTIADASGAHTPRFLVLIATAVLFAATLRNADFVTPTLSAVTLIIFVDAIFRSPLERVLPDVASSVFGLFYVGLSLSVIPRLSLLDHGSSLLLFLFCTVWAGDIAALYVGRPWGRHKLAPLISPNKSWEGAVASVAGSVLVAILLVVIANMAEQRGSNVLGYPGPVWHWMLLAVLLNIAAQLGDLVESALKRGAGVKDSGTMLPGHGGMLDRIDALLLAAPVLWYAQLVRQYLS